MLQKYGIIFIVVFMQDFQNYVNNLKKLKNQELLFYARFEVEKHVTKKNSRQIFKRAGKPFLGKNQALRDAENYMLQKLRVQKDALGLNEPLGCDMHAVFVFGFSDYFTKKGQRSLRLGDLSNLYQLPEDCLEKAEIIKNDSLICSHDLSRRLPSKKNEIALFILKYS